MSSPVTVMLLLKRMDCNDGVFSYCQTVIEGLRARGDHVVIVSGPVTKTAESEFRYQRMKDNVLDWIVIPKIRSPFNIPKSIFDIVKVVRKYKVDVISPQGFAVSPIARAVGTLTGRPIVLNYLPSLVGKLGMETQADSHRKEMQVKFLSRVTFPDKFIAISREMETFFIDVCGIAKSRIELISTGVDAEFFTRPSDAQRKAAQARLAVPPGHLVCSLVARLNFVKGHDVAIEAARILRRDRPDLKLLFLFGGGGDQEAEIKRLAFQDAEDERTFRFLGFGSNEGVRDIFWASDIFLLPSRYEGFGLVVAEAMLCGCVPIRTRTGGAAEQIIEGETGFTIDMDDAAGLARHIAALADPELRARLGANAARHAAVAFSRSRMIERTSELFRSVARRAN